MRILVAATLFATALAGPASAQLQYAALQPARQQRLSYVVDFLRQSRLLDNVSAGVNASVNIPGPIHVLAQECGQINAFYYPQQRTVIICYEMVDEIFGEFRGDGLSQGQFSTAVNSVATFILLHEIGHALIDVLRLPTTGREEDSVDQFATLILGEGSAIQGHWAAEYWRQRNDVNDTGLKLNQTPFSDEHGFDEQRYYNVLCWTYGRDPQNRQDLLRYIPQARAVRCPGESAQLRNAWLTILQPHRRTGQPQQPQQPAGEAWISGLWDYAETLGAQGTAMYCLNRGIYNFAAQGGSLGGAYTQTGRCTINGAAVDNPGSGQFQGRTYAPNGAVEFTIETCRYTANVTGREIRGGQVFCRLNVGGTVTDVRGAWNAVKR